MVHHMPLMVHHMPPRAHHVPLMVHRVPFVVSPSNHLLRVSQNTLFMRISPRPHDKRLDHKSMQACEFPLLPSHNYNFVEFFFGDWLDGQPHAFSNEQHIF